MMSLAFGSTARAGAGALFLIFVGSGWAQTIVENPAKPLAKDAGNSFSNIRTTCRSPMTARSSSRRPSSS